MIALKQFALAFALFIAADYVWLSAIASKLYTENLGKLLRLGADGKMQAIIPSALLVYVALAAGVAYFILPKASGPASAALVGAAFGAITYAVYELTNHALVSGWPLKIVIVDILWGTVLTAAVSAAVAYAIR
ncbi:MAG TPA: DUF2177 family protein [Candidatus Paceibacterota bacterium]